MKWSARIFYLMLLIAVLSMPVYLDQRSNGQFLGIEGFLDRVKALPSKALAFFQEKESGQEGFNQSGTAQVSGELPVETTGTYYRWKDDQGIWHFSDEKPEGIVAETAQPNPVMTIPALKTEPKTQQKSGNNTLQPMHVNPLSVDSAVNVMENAKSAAAMMEERQQALKEIVGEQ